MEKIDRLVAAILAATKAAAEKKETSSQYVLEYEKMIRVFDRRAKARDENGPAIGSRQGEASNRR